MNSLLRSLSDERSRRREARIRALQAERAARVEAIFARLPRLREISEQMTRLGLEMARLALRQTGSNGRTGADLAERGVALQRERQAVLAEHGIDPHDLEVHWDCPDCRDTGWQEPPVAPGQESAAPPRKCHCLLQEEIDDLFEFSGLSRPQREQIFAAFDLTLYPQADRPNMEMVLAECRRFAADLAAGRPTDNLLLMGEVGLGKTFLASAIVNEVVAQRKVAVYFTFPEFTDLLRRERFSNNEDRGAALQRLLDTDLLVLDDLAAEKVSDWVAQELFNVLNHRINRGLPLVVSTNLTLAELSDLYGDRIYSRLIGSSDVLRLSGQDVRLLLRRRKRQAGG